MPINLYIFFCIFLAIIAEIKVRDEKLVIRIKSHTDSHELDVDL